MEATELRSKLSASRLPNLSNDLITMLLEGVERETLDSLMPSESEEQRQLDRMNLVGSLRALGFVVEGGRQNRSAPYRVVDWAEKVSGPSVEEWSDVDRAKLAHVMFNPVTAKHYRDIDFALSMKPIRQPIQENTTLEILSYELGSAGTTGYWVNGAIVIKRFETRPSFRIHPFSHRSKEIVDLAQYLGAISCRPVSIVGLELDVANRLKAMMPRSSIVAHLQAIYDIKKLASMSREIFSKTDIERFRRSQRDTPFAEMCNQSIAARQVVDTWKETVGKRQRQLSIGRDYAAIELDVPKVMYVGFRNEIPVTLQIAGFFPYCSFSHRYACHYVEKSMNYSWQPAGRSGTADWGIVRTCQLLADRGYEWLNFGHIQGGAKGLETHKHRLLSTTVNSYDVVTPFYRKETQDGS